MDCLGYFCNGLIGKDDTLAQCLGSLTSSLDFFHLALNREVFAILGQPWVKNFTEKSTVTLLIWGDR